MMGMNNNMDQNQMMYMLNMMQNNNNMDNMNMMNNPYNNMNMNMNNMDQNQMMLMMNMMQNNNNMNNMNMNNMNNMNMNNMNMMNNQFNNMNMNNMDQNQLMYMMNMFMQNMNANNGNPNNFMNNQNTVQTDDNNANTINLFFCKEQRTYNILTNYNETLGTVISKYISQTQDNNVNMYITNGKKINESLTVGEAGLIGGSTINVVPTQNILGADFTNS